MQFCKGVSSWYLDTANLKFYYANLCSLPLAKISSLYWEKFYRLAAQISSLIRCNTKRSSLVTFTMTNNENLLKNCILSLASQYIIINLKKSTRSSIKLFRHLYKSSSLIRCNKEITLFMVFGMINNEILL